MKTARHLAKAALKAKLIACANLVPRIESHYWWRGKVESAVEVLMVMKTTRRNLPALERLVRAGHPYDTPEFLVVSPQSGAARYLRWLADSVA